MKQSGEKEVNHREPKEILKEIEEGKINLQKMLSGIKKAI